MYILPVLRFVSIFILLLLLFNPTIQSVETYLEKPNLIVAFDDSQSIKNLQQAENLRGFKNEILSNAKLLKRFNLQAFRFGSDLYSLKDSLAFDQKSTNQGRVLEELKKLDFSGPAAVLFLTDGNQNIGNDFQYTNLPEKSVLFPIIVGDTTASEDISIANLNTNKYAFLKNKFPVEIIVNYKGAQKRSSVLEIQESGKTIYTRNLNLDKNKNSEIVKLELPASSLGSHVFTARLSPLASEKNVANNKQSFAVDVIEEKSSVLILSSFVHPDLGALKKAIESNEQRTAKIELIKDFNFSELKDFQVFILYQPNDQFQSLFQKVQEQNLNYLVITGTQTDWKFLNSVQKNFSREITTQTQEVVPVYNSGFKDFQFEDIGFEDFPPVVESFGKLSFSQNKDPLLYQKIEGLNTSEPLLATFTTNSQKSAVLLGENFWKWRSFSFQQTSSFEKFDDFFGKLIQFLTSVKNRDRLTFTTKPYYLQDETVEIDAQYFDKNYVFDPTGKMDINVYKNDSLVVESPMLNEENKYQAKLNNLSPGEYSFTVSEKTSGISKHGKFSVLEFNLEKQTSSADYTRMKAFAERNNSGLYFLRDKDKIINQLLSGSEFKPVQKSHKKTTSLIDWKILLALLIGSLAAEWFIRKYRGLI